MTNIDNLINVEIFNINNKYDFNGTEINDININKYKIINNSNIMKYIKKPKLSDDELINITKSKDIQTGKYEGGLKIWECSIDLAIYLSQNNKLIPINNRILELGCGNGIPGIVLLQNSYQVDFQDLNKDVLLNSTTPNIILNQNNSYNDISNINLISGSWEKMILIPELKYDVIITSEVYFYIIRLFILNIQ